MAEQRICARPECSQVNTRGLRTIYCSDQCRKKMAWKRYRQGASSTAPVETKGEPEDPVEQERQAMERREQVTMLRSLAGSEAKRERYCEAIQEVLAPFKPSTPTPLTGRAKETKTNVDWAFHITDWHVGQHTKIEHTGGIYEQTTAITRIQVDKLLKAIKDIHKEATGKHVRKLWIPITGDIIEGDGMRPSQLREIDMAVTQQTVVALDLLSYAIRSLATLPGLETIEVDMVGGNHDRTSQKPGGAGLGETDYIDTYAWLIGEMLKRAFEDDPRVSVKNWHTFFGYREFAGLKHVFEHGAAIKGGGGYGGVPWYPIHNRARLLDAELGGVDCVWFGHWHIPYWLPLGQRGWVLGGGALPATSTYVQSKMMKTRMPTQTLVEFHREHGLTKVEPLYANVGLVKPGDIWKQ